MNIGWIFVGCALVILVIKAFTPWRKSERVNVREGRMSEANQRFLNGPDEGDAYPVRRDEITRLLALGQKIEAIKLYRADTGASLADARAAVERMELAPGPVTPGERHTPATPGAVPASLRRDVETLVMRGQKIQAIKRYREQTGLGLREAKEAVDALEQELFVPGTTTSFQHEGESGNALLIAGDPDEEVRRSVLEGRKIEAIKRYREQTGLGLRQAKEVVDALEQELFMPGSTSSRAAEDPDEEVRRFVLEGRKIEAIKRYREQTGLGLREAKEAVDALEQELLLPDPTSAFQRDEGSEDARRATVEPGEEVRRYMLEGRKIEAIKRYREQTGLGLREAREVIERLEQN